MCTSHYAITITCQMWMNVCLELPNANTLVTITMDPTHVAAWPDLDSRAMDCNVKVLLKLLC